MPLVNKMSVKCKVKGYCHIAQWNINKNHFKLFTVHNRYCPDLLFCSEVSGIEGIKVVGQTEDSIQVDWKNPAIAVDHFKLTHSSPDGQGGEENVAMSQEAKTMHTIVGQSAAIHQSTIMGPWASDTVCWIQWLCSENNMNVCFSGLNPGTEYQIGVQVIKGEIEGKPSYATGVTGQ